MPAVDEDRVSRLQKISQDRWWHEILAARRGEAQPATLVHLPLAPRDVHFFWLCAAAQRNMKRALRKGRFGVPCARVACTEKQGHTVGARADLVSNPLVPNTRGGWSHRRPSSSPPSSHVALLVVLGEATVGMPSAVQSAMPGPAEARSPPGPLPRVAGGGPQPASPDMAGGDAWVDAIPDEDEREAGGSGGRFGLA